MKFKAVLFEKSNKPPDGEVFLVITIQSPKTLCYSQSNSNGYIMVAWHKYHLNYLLQ